jgi:hypothetical protein
VTKTVIVIITKVDKKGKRKCTKKGKKTVVHNDTENGVQNTSSNTEVKIDIVETTDVITGGKNDTTGSVVVVENYTDLVKNKTTVKKNHTDINNNKHS